MADTSTNFFINSSYNLDFDITWSFQFKLSGENPNSTGGFSTFLFDNPTLIGGGQYSGLGYAPYESRSGVKGAIIGAMVTNDCKLVVKHGYRFDDLKIINNILNEIDINSNTLFDKDFITIRFNLTNIGKILNIHIKDPSTDTYKMISSIDTGLIIRDNNFYKIGFGYSSSLDSGDPKTALILKDIHIQGSINSSTTKILKPPFDFPSDASFYLVQSPTYGKILIGQPDPIVGGYLMNK
jgi:hypothetical protein